MKKYKVISVKQKGILTAKTDKLVAEVEELLNEKCSAGWELVDITWTVDRNFSSIAYLTFRY